jgi:hypothetical protein
VSLRGRIKTYFIIVDFFFFLRFISSEGLGPDSGFSLAFFLMVDFLFFLLRDFVGLWINRVYLCCVIMSAC